MKDMLKKIYNVIDNRFYFKLLYLFVSLIFVTILIDIPGIKIFSKIAQFWSVILILLMIIEDRKRRKIYRFDVVLGCFLVLTLIYSIFIYKNVKDIETWIINLILFTTIFTVDVFKNRQKLIKETNIITNCYCIFMFIAAIISLVLRFSSEMISIGQIQFGSYKGIFINENALSIACAICITMSLYLNQTAKNHKAKLFWAINIILQLITMIGSRGRSAILAVVAIIFTFIFVYLKNKYLRISLVLIPILIIASIFSSFDETTIRDFTSGRSSLWTSASIVIKDNSLVGVGSGNFVEAVRNARDTTDLPGLEAGGLHNIYIQIATMNGIIALILMIAFLYMIIAFIIKRLDKLKRKEKLQMTTLTSMLIGIIIVNLFESNLIYIISFISMIFWIYSGYLVSILDNKNIE